MKNDGLDKSGDTAVGSDHCIDFSKLERKEGAEENSLSSVGQTSLEGEFPELGSVSSTKKAALSRSDSFQEQCRVCQQQAEEALIDLGCQCRGGLAKAHRSCIDTWFHTRGSNKCEICQQIAINVPPPESQPSRNYWVWRVDPSFRASGIAPERERLYSPLWVAFSILIGGLLLDVLISISLGVTALPVNIIIGVLVVLGLGTAFRLALECFHELSLRRTVQNMDRNVILGPPGSDRTADWRVQACFEHYDGAGLPQFNMDVSMRGGSLDYCHSVSLINRLSAPQWAHFIESVPVENPMIPVAKTL